MKRQEMVQDEVIRWVSLAIPSKKMCAKLFYKDREAYARMLIEKDEGEGYKVVCTDGLRLHVAKVKRALPEGCWQLSSTLAKTNNGKSVPLEPSTGKFPNYRRVIPEKENLRKVGEFDTSRNNTLTEFAFLLYGAGIKIRLEHMEDLCGIPGVVWGIYVRFTPTGMPDRSKAVLFESKDYTAVVMPLLL